MFESSSDTDSETDSYTDIINIDSYKNTGQDPDPDSDIKNNIYDKIRENIHPVYVYLFVSVSIFSIISYLTFTYKWRV